MKKIFISNKTALKIMCVAAVGFIVFNFTSCKQKSTPDSTNTLEATSSFFSSKELDNKTQYKEDIPDEMRVGDLIIEDNILTFNVDDKSTIVSKLQYNEFLVDPKSVLISDIDSSEYYVVYYSYPSCGDAGVNFYVYAIQHDKKEDCLDVIWNGDKMSVTYSFNKYILNISHPNSKQRVTSEDLSTLFNSLESEIVSRVLNGDIMLSTVSDIGINDYNSDGEKEIFLRYDITNVQTSLYLTSIYFLIDFEEGNIVIKKMFLCDMNDKTISNILKHGFALVDEVDRNDMKKLLEKEIVKKEDSRLIVNFTEQIEQ